MKQGQRLWTREELIIAINLYCKIPFGRLHSRNPEIIHLSTLVDRTPDAVAFKLVNFASLDPSLQARGIKGASNVSKLDRVIWNEFYNNWNDLAFESELLLAKYNHTTVEELNHINDNELLREGTTREQIVRVRVNQSFFRKSILASYNNTCCITGIQQPELLIASHIVPWSVDKRNRLNPSNGIALNPLHDKAFELGYLTITPDYLIKVSPSILKNEHKSYEDLFHVYHNKKMKLPNRFLPDKQFLASHNLERFISG